MNFLPLLLCLSLQNEVQAARDAARTQPKPATVVLRGGTHFLPETLVFTAQDSDVTYTAAPNEKVVLSGGRRITGWNVEGGVWTVKTDLRFNQLFVDGKRRTRARTPKGTRPARCCCSPAMRTRQYSSNPLRVYWKNGDKKFSRSTPSKSRTTAVRKTPAPHYSISSTAGAF